MAPSVVTVSQGRLSYHPVPKLGKTTQGRHPWAAALLCPGPDHVPPRTTWEPSSPSSTLHQVWNFSAAETLRMPLPWTHCPLAAFPSLLPLGSIVPSCVLSPVPKGQTLNMPARPGSHRKVDAPSSKSPLCFTYVLLESLWLSLPN